MTLGGRFDEHLRQIENTLSVEIHNRSNHFTLMGTKKAVHQAKTAIEALYKASESMSEFSPENIQLYLQTSKKGTPLPRPTPSLSVERPTEGIDLGKKFIQARSENQLRYIQSIRENDINFGIGPAGTGKTYLAVACAVAALESHQVKRIILVRPAVEAGERLGFLPGDLSQKIDPYLRPLFDALYEMLGLDHVLKLIERNIIELAPLAYMRGRTLNDAFVLLDEGQNTTPEQMKMFLTRLGFNSKAIVTGDITQIDLNRAQPSGLKQAIQLLHSIPGIHFTYFNSSDVVRHPLVQHIIEAYHAFEDRN
jgi:phosphate starvation-inducible PhoH-like protein